MKTAKHPLPKHPSSRIVLRYAIDEYREVFIADQCLTFGNVIGTPLLITVGILFGISGARKWMMFVAFGIKTMGFVKTPFEI